MTYLALNVLSLLLVMHHSVATSLSRAEIATHPTINRSRNNTAEYQLTSNYGAT